MSVLIKGMKMPENDSYLKVFIYPNGTVYYAVGQSEEPYKSCAIEIPHVIEEQIEWLLKEQEHE